MKKIRRRLNVLKAPVCVMDSEKVIVSPKRCFRPGRHSRSWLDAVKLSAGSLKASCNDEDHADECGLYGCDTSTKISNKTTIVAQNISGSGFYRDVNRYHYITWISVSVDTSDDYYWYFTMKYAVETYVHVDHQEALGFGLGWVTNSSNTYGPDPDHEEWSYYGEVTLVANYNEEFSLVLDYYDGDYSGGTSGSMDIHPWYSYLGPNITLGCTSLHSGSHELNPQVSYDIFFAEC